MPSCFFESQTNQISLNGKKKISFEARVLHTEHIPDSHIGSRAVPIYATAGFVFDTPDKAVAFFVLTAVWEYVFASHDKGEYKANME